MISTVTQQTSMNIWLTQPAYVVESRGDNKGCCYYLCCYLPFCCCCPPLIRTILCFIVGILVISAGGTAYSRCKEEAAEPVGPHDQPLNPATCWYISGALLAWGVGSIGWAIASIFVFRRRLAAMQAEAEAERERLEAARQAEAIRQENARRIDEQIARDRAEMELAREQGKMLQQVVMASIVKDLNRPAASGAPTTIVTIAGGVPTNPIANAAGAPIAAVQSQPPPPYFVNENAYCQANAPPQYAHKE